MRFKSVLFPTFCGLLLLPLGCDSGGEPLPVCETNINLKVSDIQASPCGEEAGSIRLLIGGGDGNYRFQLNQADYARNDGIFTDLSAGTHLIHVHDGEDCEGEIEVHVPSNTHLAEIYPILDNNCAVSGCHIGSNPARINFKAESNILSHVKEIQERTSSGNMPPKDSDYSLTDQEIVLISCWANDGGPE